MRSIKNIRGGAPAHAKCSENNKFKTLNALCVSIRHSDPQGLQRVLRGNGDGDGDAANQWK